MSGLTETRNLAWRVSGTRQGRSQLAVREIKNRAELLKTWLALTIA